MTRKEKAMTKKDYILIADSIRSTPTDKNGKLYIADLIAVLCTSFKSDNKRFNSSIFTEYCK